MTNEPNGAAAAFDENDEPVDIVHPPTEAARATIVHPPEKNAAIVHPPGKNEKSNG